MSERATGEAAPVGEGSGFTKHGTINHIRLTVSDIARAERFYDPLLEFLGYRLNEKSDVRLAWLVVEPDGTKRLFIVSRAASAVRHDRSAPGLHHLAFNVDSRAAVDRFHRLLQETGATILDAPAEYDYQPGYYAVFFADPDGIKLEVVHIPPPP